LSAKPQAAAMDEASAVHWAVVWVVAMDEPSAGQKVLMWEARSAA
jgi:hypothetical protein